jgi:hypothetical protein
MSAVTASGQEGSLQRAATLRAVFDKHHDRCHDHEATMIVMLVRATTMPIRNK